MEADEAARGRPGERERLEGVVSDRNGPQRHGLRPDRMADGGHRARMAIRATTDTDKPAIRHRRRPRLAPLATAQGFAPGVTVRAGDLADGRPAPVQIWHARAAMGCIPHAPSRSWAAGIAPSGKIAGLKVEDLAARDAPAWEAR